MILLRQCARLAAALALALFASLAAAQTAPTNSVLQLDPPLPVATGSRIEVIEFFYYGCPVCYELQPHLSRWMVQAPEYVALIRVPALSSENWEPFAKLYYTLESLGEVTRLHWPVFDNFHFDDVRLNEENVMLDWVGRNGIDRQKFAATYRSPEVQARVTRARNMVNNYGVRGVPALVVDGKYLSSPRLAGGTKELIQVLDQLVRRARSERPN
ncbi:MAG: thiol:disulfide interchange protein DsbA/DsbL [Betaproteobacteria bacterium]|nr:thiol:disulfide interchange protein DsbA/DsbL [Betaproteobacteria bacterium]